MSHPAELNTANSVSGFLVASRRKFLRGLSAALAIPALKQLSGETIKKTRTYKNPLNVVIGDPNVVRAPGGQYYIYGSGEGGGAPGTAEDSSRAFHTFTSANLVDWTPVGMTYHRDPETSWGVGDFWAPEVYFVRGKFYMFYSAQWRDNPTNEKENFRIGVAVSDKPTGPFVDVRNKPLFDPGYPAIDVDLLFDDDGRVYLYYSRCCYKHPVESELADLARKNGWYTEIEESWVYGVEVKPDFTGIIGEPVVILRPPVTMSDPTTAWENLSVTMHEANRRWTEGPCSFKRYGKYFVMYSANSVFADNYSLGYATSDSPLGPFVKAANNPVASKTMDRGGGISCTAHNCVTMSPDGSEMFCLFGGRTKESGRERVLILCRMEVQKEGTLVIYPPDTVTPQPYPSGSQAS